MKDEYLGTRVFCWSCILKPQYVLVVNALYLFLPKKNLAGKIHSRIKTAAKEKTTTCIFGFAVFRVTGDASTLVVPILWMYYFYDQKLVKIAKTKNVKHTCVLAIISLQMADIPITL